MATRSRIGIQQKDGSVLSIYCHFDGYIEGNGKLLLKYYKTRSRVQKLIALGDISYLAPKLGSSKPNPSFDSNTVVAYCRDRQERLRQRFDVDISKFSQDYEQYGYLFTVDSEWKVIRSGYGGEFEDLQYLVKYNKSLSKSAAVDLIMQSKGKIFTATFKKKDNTIRKINCRIGVKKGVNGNGLKFNPTEKGLKTVYDMCKQEWRLLNLETLITLTIDRQSYKITN